MANEEYQVLIRRPGAEARTRLLDGAPAGHRDELASSVADVPDGELPGLLADLGGHDLDELERTLRAADLERSRSSVLFAYYATAGIDADHIVGAALLAIELVDEPTPLADATQG